MGWKHQVYALLRLHDLHHYLMSCLPHCDQHRMPLSISEGRYQAGLRFLPVHSHILDSLGYMVRIPDTYFIDGVSKMAGDFEFFPISGYAWVHKQSMILRSCAQNPVSRHSEHPRRGSRNPRLSCCPKVGMIFASDRLGIYVWLGPMSVRNPVFGRRGKFLVVFEGLVSTPEHALRPD